MWFLVASLVAVATCVAGLAASTATGARRRGRGWSAALVAGAAFPVTWALWYAVDAGHLHDRRRPH